MKKRQRNKILKRSGIKLKNEKELTLLEKVVCGNSAESKVCSAISKFNIKEYEEGTLYGVGYFERLITVMKSVTTIENVTGVKTSDT